MRPPVRSSAMVAGALTIVGGCQVLTGIGDYATDESLGSGASPPSTTSAGGGGTPTSTTSAGEGGSGGGGIDVPPPVVVWRYAGTAPAGSFSRGQALGAAGGNDGAIRVVGTLGGSGVMLPEVSVPMGVATRGLRFVLSGDTTPPSVSGAAPMVDIEGVHSALTSVSRTGAAVRGGLQKPTAGTTALLIDTTTPPEFSLENDDDVASFELGDTVTRVVGVQQVSGSDVAFGASFTGNTNLGNFPIDFPTAGRHALIARVANDRLSFQWALQLGPTGTEAGDLWIEDLAFDDGQVLAVGRYSGSSAAFGIRSNGPGPMTTTPLPMPTGTSQSVTDAFFVEFDLDDGMGGEVRGINQPGNQAFTEVERDQDNLYIGGHYSSTLAFGASPVATGPSDEERGFVARLNPIGLAGARVITFAGAPGSARVTSMAARNDDVYVTVDCSGTIDVEVVVGLEAFERLFSSSGGNDDLCFFGFDMSTSPPSPTTAARFDGDVVRARDMIVDGGAAIVTGAYEGTWDLPGDPLQSEDEALFVLRLGLP